MPRGVYVRTKHPLRGRDVLDTPSYWGVHTRLRVRRGPAKTHQCADCGEQARTWAYKNAEGFSSNLDDYRPLCYSCHHTQDKNSAKRR